VLITVHSATVSIDPSEWADLIDDAGYGIAYWAAPPAVVDDENLTYTVRVYGSLEDPGEPGDDSEPITEVVITLPMLEAAVAELITTDARRFASFYEQDYDADDLDILIQLAVFGRVIYG
jgi:hypothetical protein